MIKIPEKFSDRESSYHLYSVQLNIDRLKISRSQFIEELKKNGIGSSVHFIPLYRHPFYKNTFNLQEKDYINSEFVFPKLVSLPIWPRMTDLQITKVIEGVLSILKQNRL
jgi:perosamine synthetase